jgi:hypothetical protein
MAFIYRTVKDFFRIRTTKEMGSLIKGKETHVFYVTRLYEYMHPFTSYAAHVEKLSEYISDDKWLDDVYNLAEGKRRAAEFFFLCLSVFSTDAIADVCAQMAAHPRGVDGKEFLFVAEQALSEMKRYFFRHTRRLSELYIQCGYGYQQTNETTLPLALSVSITESGKAPVYVLPSTYRHERFENLPELPEYAESIIKSPLSYLSVHIAQGLSSLSHQSFYKANEMLFSVFLADEELWLATYTAAPDDDLAARAMLVDLMRSHCKKAEILPHADDPRMLNNWLTFDEKERLKHLTVNGIREEIVIINHNDSDGEITSIAGLNYKRRVNDAPSWQQRFHASALTFKYWNPKGFVTMGKNVITEYRDVDLLQKAVAEETDGDDDKADLFGLAQYISQAANADKTDNPDNINKFDKIGEFERHVKERLYDFTKLIRFATGRKAGANFTEYYKLLVEPFLRKHAYAALIPQSRVGEAYAGQPVYAYAEPAAECQELCDIVTSPTKESAGDYAQPTVIGMSLGFIKGGEVIVRPAVIIEVPVSAFDCLTSLVDKMEEEKRGDMDFLSGRVYLTQFINYSKKLEIFARQKDLTHRQKWDFLTQNHFYYTLFNSTPETAFEKTAVALGSQVDRYRDAFVKVWNANLERLKNLGINETVIAPGFTMVTHSQLMDGWKKENREKRRADAEHPADLVYEVIQKGIEVDGVLIQCPIVNVYAKQ